MNLKHRILSRNPERNSVEVRFFSDALPEESLDVEPHAAKRADGTAGRCALDLNIDLPKDLADEDAYISSFAPINKAKGLMRDRGLPVEPDMAANAPILTQHITPIR